MVVLVLAREVGVHGVAHVRADEERARDGLRVRGGRRREPLEQERDERRLGAGRRDRANLLVVEERDAVHVALERAKAARGGEGRDGFDSAVPTTVLDVNHARSGMRLTMRTGYPCEGCKRARCSDRRVRRAGHQTSGYSKT